MSLDLPAPIATCFAADKGDSDTLALCFTEDAVVKVEGHTRYGRAAIREWKSGTSVKCAYTSMPVAVKDRDGKTVVICHLVGDVPGSPLDLRYFFVIEGGKIAFLEIIP